MNTTLGRLINHVPYRVIPGIGVCYNDARNYIEQFENADNKKKIIFDRIYNIVKYALENIPFYQDYYKSKGFSITQLQDFDDLQKIPIVKKKDLIDIDIEYRSAPVRHRYIANTGGSTGRPFSFYKTKKLKIKEFAYFHKIWSTIGYKKTDLRLHFVGRNSFKTILHYNFIENSIQVSVYTPFDQVLSELRKLNVNISYLHGYPSVLYEFAIYCENHPVEFKLSGLDLSLKGAFLKSEYPYEYYRKEIEKVFNVKTISHYGHSETIALAYELNVPFEYKVLQSYGYVENVCVDGESHIVATTYDNLASPLIRYDTEDVIENPIWIDGILNSFSMKGGRKGDFIVDKNGKNISLTGLIFGKHHKLFSYSSQIQISQKRKGEATIYYVPINPLPEDFEASSFFDSSNLEIEFRFIMIDKPIKTKLGKVLLKV